MQKGSHKSYFICIITLLLGFLFTSLPILAQSTAFSYQGKLSDSGNPANGNYDLQFKLFDTVTVGTGTQQGSTVTVSSVSVSNGNFSITLDFGASVFTGADRFLEIAVRPAGGVDPYTILSPRQPLTATPYAVRSTIAATADYALNASQLGGLAASGFIQNNTAPQAATNFNISGTGTASVLNAATQFNLGGSRVLSAAGTANLFAGINAGQANGAGGLNAFFGGYAGAANTAGSDNSFFGAFAGGNNTTGASNSFFGRYAGLANTTGSNTTMVGSNAGLSNTTENENTFVGASSNGAAGIMNATAIGAQALVTQSNSLILGSINGVNGATADSNVGIGTTAPAAKLHVRGVSPVRILGDTTTLAGAEAVDFFAWSSIYGTDLGGMRIQRQVGSGNIDTLLFAAANGGSAAEVMRVSGNGKVGIGTDFPTAKLEVYGGSLTGVRGVSSSEGVVGIGSSNGLGVHGESSSGIGVYGFSGSGWAGFFDGKVYMSGRVGIGTTSPSAKLHVEGGSGDSIGVRGDSVSTGVYGTSSGTGGTGVSGYSSGSSGDGVYGYSSNGLGVHGVSSSGSGVHGYSASGWAGFFDGDVRVRGTLTQDSDARLKQNINTLNYGLSEVLRLRPVSWRWKDHPERGQQLGLVAQEVEPVLPELVTTAKDAEQMKGLNYTGLLPVLIKAMQEQQQQLEQYRTQLAQQQSQIRQQQILVTQQQTQIKQQETEIRQQQQQIKRQQSQIEALKKLVCLDHPKAEICQ